MRIAGLILGVLGGLAGLVVGTFSLAIGGVEFAVGADSADTIVSASGSMFTCTIIGIVGGALALSKPVWAGWLQLLAGIGGLVVFSAIWLPAFPLFLIGGLLCLVHGIHQKIQAKPGSSRSTSEWVCAECGFKLLYQDDKCPRCRSEKRRWTGA